MEKTSAKIEMSANKDQSLTFLISGKQEIVLKARRELLVQFQTQASVSIGVPKDHHKYILGRGGAKLQVIFFFQSKKSRLQMMHIFTQISLINQ